MLQREHAKYSMDEDMPILKLLVKRTNTCNFWFLSISIDTKNRGGGLGRNHAREELQKMRKW